MPYRRRRRRLLSLDFLSERHKLQLPDSAGSLEEQALAVEARLERYEVHQTIVRLMETLPVGYQAVLALRYFEKKKLAEISEITGKNLRTVKSLLSRATGRLKARQAAIGPIGGPPLPPAPDLAGMKFLLFTNGQGERVL